MRERKRETRWWSLFDDCGSRRLITPMAPLHIRLHIVYSLLWFRLKCVADNHEQLWWVYATIWALFRLGMISQAKLVDFYIFVSPLALSSSTAQSRPMCIYTQELKQYQTKWHNADPILYRLLIDCWLTLNKIKKRREKSNKLLLLLLLSIIKNCKWATVVDSHEKGKFIKRERDHHHHHRDERT